MMALFALAGCATAPSARSLAGEWGGNHVGLDLGEAIGKLEYDCATGTIDEPLLIDSSGRFTGVGTHRPGTGGPDRVGVIPPSYPARYSGSVRGEVMTLVVDVEAINARLGPYALRHGAVPNLTRCL